jgi:hypothetical protein
MARMPRIGAVALVGMTLAAAPTARAADPVVMAAGDIACDTADPLYLGGNGDAADCAQRRTAALLDPATAVLAVGDNQYNTGAFAQYLAVFDTTWGRFKSKLWAVPGNHEYGRPNASGYFQYFGSKVGTAGQGWYSFNLGQWHVIALNSECDFLPAGTCAAGGPEDRFIKADLAANPRKCTLAFWHQPPYSSGSAPVKNAEAMKPLWRTLYAGGADLIVTAHKHFYERFAPLNATGQPVDASQGMREFIVGTGGEDQAATPVAIAGSERRKGRVFGVLRLALHSTSYDARFLAADGNTFTDVTTTACR